MSITKIAGFSATPARIAFKAQTETTDKSTVKSTTSEKKIETQIDSLANLGKLSVKLEKARPADHINVPEDSITKPSKKDEIPVGKYKNFDLRNKDVSGLEFSNKELEDACIDANTVLSDSQKTVMYPIMGNMKNPGLGIENLHKQGITGKNIINVVIDSPLSSHAEYDKNIIKYDNSDLKDKSEKGSVHSAGVVSILAGKNLGVAPDSKIMFFAADKETKEGNDTATFYANAIKKAVDENKKLPLDKKIATIVVPNKIDEKSKNFKNYESAVKSAIDDGIFVITRDLEKFYPEMKFFGADRNPEKDVNDPSSYSALTENPDALLVPMTRRTVADAIGENTYRYEGNDGGAAWAQSWLAGMYSLAKQVSPGLTPEKFFKTALSTATPLQKDGKPAGKLINPEKLVEGLSPIYDLNEFKSAKKA